MTDSRKERTDLLISLVNKWTQLSESGINVSALETGVYILEVNDGQKTVAKKFVKN
jgi:hypothetical protein